ncbi:hypothetical protein Q0Z83_041460 [Actinoplanes sichuanensis]|nr:hypothetical protein Q0Z83_041460 [Actinoplanes sichuanensis]
MAQPAGLDVDLDLALVRLGNRHVLDLERLLETRYDRGTHVCPLSIDPLLAAWPDPAAAIRADSPAARRPCAPAPNRLTDNSRPYSAGSIVANTVPAGEPVANAVKAATSFVGGLDERVRHGIGGGAALVMSRSRHPAGPPEMMRAGD